MKQTLRILSFIEGTSLLALFFYAMPLKYIWGDPRMVKIIGSLHGGLFLALVAMIFIVSAADRWPRKLTWFALISSSIPLGMFALDLKLRGFYRGRDSSVA